MSVLDVKDLPEGWSVDRIDNVCDVNPRLNKAEIPDDLLVSFVPMSAVGAGDGSINVSQERLASEVKKGFTAFKQGDVLFAKITPCMENGKMAVVPKVASGYGFGSTEFHVLRPKEGVEPRYVYYYVSSQNFRGIAERYMTGAVGQKRVSTTYLKEQEIPIAPPEQQKRIVAEIEKQFSRLDEAVANLMRVKANLRRYKAAVLKAAVEGKLTEEWREQHPDVEPADKLLERILEERRANWQGRGKFKEPVGPDASGLPELPEGWVWTNFEQLAEAIPNAIKAGPFGSALKKSFYVSEGYKVYGQEQVIRDDPYYGNYFIDDEKYRKLSSCSVKSGDLLISLVGTIGRVLILPDDIEPGIINPRLVKISLDRQLVNPLFIRTYLQSTYVKTLFAIASHGGTMDILNLGILKEIPIPLPPLEEQLTLLLEFERVASIEEGLVSEIERNQARADRLRQSILKQAFSGRLVPQNSNDEPVSMLLQRMRNDAGTNQRVARETIVKQGRGNSSRLGNSKSKPAASGFASLDAVLTAIIEHMQPGSKYSRADLADPLGLTTGQWNAAIKELKRRGKVRQVGEKRGAHYCLGDVS